MTGYPQSTKDGRVLLGPCERPQRNLESLHEPWSNFLFVTKFKGWSSNHFRGDGVAKKQGLNDGITNDHDNCPGRSNPLLRSSIMCGGCKATLKSGSVVEGLTDAPFETWKLYLAPAFCFLFVRHRMGRCSHSWNLSKGLMLPHIVQRLLVRPSSSWHDVIPHTTSSHIIYHTQLCHTSSFTHNFLTHHLSHTTLSRILFHTQLSHTQSFMHTFVTQQLCHTSSFTHTFVTQQLCHKSSFTHNVDQRHFAWQAWHLATSTLFLRGRRGTWRHPPTFVLRGRRGTWWHPPSFCVAGVLQVLVTHYLSHTPLSHNNFVTHHLSHTTLTSDTLRGRRGTWRHPPSFCVASVALGDTHLCFCVAGVALGDIHLRFAWQACYRLHLVARLVSIHRRWRRGTLHGRRGTWRHPPSPSFFVTPSFTDNFVTHNFVLLLDPPPPPLSFLPSPSPLQHLVLIIGRNCLVGFSSSSILEKSGIVWNKIQWHPFPTTFSHLSPGAGSKPRACWTKTLLNTRALLPHSCASSRTHVGHSSWTFESETTYIGSYLSYSLPIYLALQNPRRIRIPMHSPILWHPGHRRSDQQLGGFPVRVFHD